MNTVFLPNTYWMHKNFRDIFIEILEVSYADANKAKLKIRYWNLGYTGKPVVLTNPISNYTITTEDKQNWIRLTNQQLTIKRVNPGIPQ